MKSSILSQASLLESTLNDAEVDSNRIRRHAVQYHSLCLSLSELAFSVIALSDSILDSIEDNDNSGVISLDETESELSAMILQLSKSRDRFILDNNEFNSSSLSQNHGAQDFSSLSYEGIEQEHPTR